MPASDIGLNKTLAALGVAQASQVPALFAEVRAHFEGHFKTVHDESEWKMFRDRWLGRKSGVLTQITENWLKPATPELKRAAGVWLTECPAKVKPQIEARRTAIESVAEKPPWAVTA